MNYLSSRYEKDRFVQEVHTDYVVWEETGRADYRYTATMTEVRARDELAVIIENGQIYSCVLEGSLNARACHEIIAVLGQFCGEVITKCLCPYTKCSCKVMKKIS